MPAPTWIVNMRHDTAANWDLRNTILAKGVLGVVTDAGSSESPKFKIGTGTTPWKSLPWAVSKDAQGVLVFPSKDAGNAIVWGADGGIYIATPVLGPLETRVQTLEGASAYTQAEISNINAILGGKMDWQSSVTPNLDTANGFRFVFAATQDETLTFTLVDGQEMRVLVLPDVHTVSIGSAVTWLPQAPTLTPSKACELTIWQVGATTYGKWVQEA